MPIISNLQTGLVGDANTSLANAFFPRFMKSWWPEICGTTKSTRLVEPFALDGAAPLMRRFNGSMAAQGVGSWSMNCPNLLFKSLELLDRTSIETDQTRTVVTRAGRIGLRAAETWDYLLAKRILSANAAASASVNFKGQTYYTTFENGVPFFSTAHTSYGGGNQSNIVQGVLPATVAAYQALDIGTQVQAMIQDITSVINKVSGVLDDKGAPIYPDIDPQEHFIVVVPPVMRPAARLAFQTPGSIVGGTGGTSGGSGSTTNIGSTLVKKVMSPGLLKGGIPDIDNDEITTVSATNPTDYWVFIDNDLVRPFYFQRFAPKAAGETMPLGYDPEALVKEILNTPRPDGLKVSMEAAEVYAATMIEHNLNALGANGQLSVAETESFFMSGRARGNIVYGPWFTGYRICPASAS